MDYNISSILEAVRKVEANKGRKPKVADPKKHHLEVEDWQELQKGDVSIAEALRRAQVSLIRSSKFNHPNYWSSFFAIGNGL